MPDFLAALYAAVCAIKDNELGEAEIMFTECDGEGSQTLMVTIRREVTEAADAA
jgi:hypothetical protein